jgi:hypothetical protein
MLESTVSETVAGSIDTRGEAAAKRMGEFDVVFHAVLSMIEDEITYQRRVGAQAIVIGLGYAVDQWKITSVKVTEFYQKLGAVQILARAVTTTMTKPELVTQFDAIGNAVIEARDAAFAVNNAAQTTDTAVTTVLGNEASMICQAIGRAEQASNIVANMLHHLHEVPVQESARNKQATGRQA